MNEHKDQLRKLRTELRIAIIKLCAHEDHLDELCELNHTPNSSVLTDKIQYDMSETTEKINNTISGFNISTPITYPTRENQ